MKNQKNSAIKAALIIFTLFCFLDMPYWYYQLFRIVGTGGFLYLAFLEKVSKIKYSPLVFFSFAILLNPFLKISFGREGWLIVDAIIIFSTLLSFFQNHIVSFIIKRGFILPTVSQENSETNENFEEHVSIKENISTYCDLDELQPEVYTPEEIKPINSLYDDDGYESYINPDFYFGEYRNFMRENSTDVPPDEDVSNSKRFPEDIDNSPTKNDPF